MHVSTPYVLVTSDTNNVNYMILLCFCASAHTRLGMLLTQAFSPADPLNNWIPQLMPCNVCHNACHQMDAKAIAPAIDKPLQLHPCAWKKDQARAVSNELLCPISFKFEPIGTSWHARIHLRVCTVLIH